MFTQHNQPDQLMPREERKDKTRKKNKGKKEETTMTAKHNSNQREWGRAILPSKKTPKQATLANDHRWPLVRMDSRTIETEKRA